MPKILENVKEEIIKVAREMVLVERITNINIRDLASRCNISTGTIYNYFNSKQDIIISVVWQEWHSTIDSIDKYNVSTNHYMDKLSFVFSSLRLFLNAVHNIDYGNYFDYLELQKTMCMKNNKKDIHELLCTKISTSLSDVDTINKNDNVLFSLIAKIFTSYALDSNINFDTLKPYIEKLIN